MSERDDGESAFPRTVTEFNCDAMVREVTSDGGMSLRDYFAAKAMAALVTAMPHMQNLRTIDGGTPKESDVAGQAYEFADAMLEARK